MAIPGKYYTKPMSAVLIRTVLILFSVVSLFGCNDNTDPQQSSIPVSKFSAPEDGKLTEKQVADYVAIRHQIIREVSARDKAEMISLIEGEDNPDNRSDFLYFDEIEKAVANAAGMSYKEFIWIKDTLISTQTTMWLQQYYELNNKIVNLLDKTLARYKEANNEKKDKDEQEIMDAHVKEMKQELTGLRGKINYQNDNTDAFVHNSAIVLKFEQALKSLEKQRE